MGDMMLEDATSTIKDLDSIIFNQSTLGTISSYFNDHDRARRVHQPIRRSHSDPEIYCREAKVRSRSRSSGMNAKRLALNPGSPCTVHEFGMSTPGSGNWTEVFHREVAERGGTPIPKINTFLAPPPV